MHPVLIGVIAMVIVVVGIVLITRTRQAASLGQAESAASHFIELIQSEEIDQAWEGTSAEFKSFIGRDRLRQLVKAHPELQEPCELVDFQPVSEQQLSLLQYRYRSTNNPHVVVRIVLGNERGEWKVERLHIDPGADAG